MPIHINLYNATELDRARGRAYHLRAYAAELVELAEGMEQRATELGADEMADLAGTLRDLAADSEAQAAELDEAISLYQDRDEAAA